jgi:hypothetical protein
MLESDNANFKASTIAEEETDAWVVDGEGDAGSTTGERTESVAAIAVLDRKSESIIVSSESITVDSVKLPSGLRHALFSSPGSFGGDSA